MKSPCNTAFSFILAGALAGSGPLFAEGPNVTSFGANGELIFDCPAPNLDYCVEWASDPDGPWHSSWEWCS